MFPPETVFVNWGYGASEGKFDVPVEAESVEGVLALFGYVYEFVKPGESVAVPLWEAADDTPYELVFTNYAGFYRYNIHDLVSWAQMQMAFAPSAFWARRPTPSRLPVMRSSVDSMDALAKSCFGAMDIEGEEGLFVLYAPGKTELSMNMVAGWIILGRTEVIGRDGYVIVADQTGTVVASDMVDQIGKTLDYSSLRTVSFFGTNLSIMDVLGEESYVRRLKVVEHDLIGVCPTAAIHSVFFTFCQMVAPIALASLALLVILLNLFLKRSMVEGVAHTNDSLAKITAGDLDERVEVRTFKEFDELSDGINSTVGKPKDLIEKEAARIDEELAMARTIQHEALPSTFPPFPQRTEFGLHASMDAAREVGGDFYDYFLIADNKLAFLVADVSDKGIPAALFMMRAKTAIKARLMNGLPIEEAMMRANEDLCANNEAGMFVTAWVGVLDTCTGIVEYVHAGHTCPVLVQGHSPAVVRKKRNFIMGGRPMIRYVRQEVALEPNDMIVLYSDGVSEAFDAQGEQYGLDRLENLLAKETPAIESDDPNRRCELACTTIKSDVARFSEGITQSDDITILCVVYLGEGTRA